MNNPKLTGIVTLYDLKDKGIFVSLKPDFLNELNDRIRLIGIYKLANILQISKRILCHWLTESSLIRLDILLKIVDYFHYSDLESKIYFLRGKDGNKIYNPKLPFDFRNSSGVRLIASILGDGGLSNKNDIIYSNTNNVLIKDFIDDLNNILGKVEVYTCRQVKDKSIIKVVYPPSFLRHVFNLIGIKTGKKVVNNPEIPFFINDLPPRFRYDFISKIIDDEGTINIKAKYISITSAVENNHNNPNILLGVQALLKMEGIHSVIYGNISYNSNRGRIRILRSLQINRYDQLKKLYNNLNIKDKNKSRKLKILLDSYTQFHYLKCSCKQIYLSKMKDIEAKNGYFTARDLSIALRRKVGYIRNVLNKYNRNGVVNKIEGVKSDGIRFYPAKFMIKNEQLY